MNVKKWLQKKRAVVQFTWQGSAECFKKFGPLLLAGFHEGGISWKRDDPSCPYPIQLRFTAQFVPFEEGLLLTSPTTQRCSQAAFLHVYFLSVATVEEYRSELPRFAEWFSLVKDAAWFILFDSSRARENKTRSSKWAVRPTSGR
ncbi:hypothetical protein M3Y99_00791300 [Aphelenchoides fujianensis]|nr:hypothetical protein M3Y99_00791300 [Aphelenchoides fujianensis]